MNGSQPKPTTISVIDSLSRVNPAQWDACANPQTSSTPYNPFISYAFLYALELSQSATSETGWKATHLILRDDKGVMQGGLPLYLKNHSQGEYVFDYNWADAYERCGGRYYPKLQSSVPFTPVVGRRILVKAGANQSEIEKTLIQTSIQLATSNHLSSVHFTFPIDNHWQHLAQLGFLLRTDRQYHWCNNHYHNFEDFLRSLSSKKRKNIRRERRVAVEAGIEIISLTGKNIQESHWDQFFSFYMNTGNRKWGTPYLTREFFSLISETMADQLLLFMCYRDGNAIAGALNLLGGDCLYGRYWGCLEYHPFLHFEVCYYQAIEYAIEHNLKRVEAGAQGEHKIFRGYVPTRTSSAHWFRDPQFHKVIANYLQSEQQQVDEEIQYLNQYLPFRKEGINLAVISLVFICRKVCLSLHCLQKRKPLKSDMVN